MAFDFHIQESISPETGEVMFGDVDLIDPDTGEIVQTIEKSVFDSGYRVCTHCGLATPWDDATYCQSDCEYYCPDCCAEQLERCEDCGGWYLREEMREVSNGWRHTKWVCEDCSEEYGTYCASCGIWHEYDDMIQCADSERWYCDSWRCRDNLWQCGDCGRHFEYDDSVTFVESEDNYYCDECRPLYEGCVGGYHTHIYDEFRCLSGENRASVPFMGFELETYAADRFDEEDVASYTEDQFGSYFAMEQDCSIGEGVEFITQPCSINYHLSKLGDIAEWSRYLVRHGYNSHNSGKCGFHIHLDKEYFGNRLDCATAKLLFLFERHWDNMIRFSRRNSNQVSRWCGKYDKYDEMKGYSNEQVVPGKKYASILKKEYKERYRAVNLCPTNTIEIRMWRGSLNIETIEATLKFTARLMELCKHATAVELYHMAFEDLLGDDPVVRSYWERVKNRSI